MHPPHSKQLLHLPSYCNQHSIQKESANPDSTLTITNTLIRPSPRHTYPRFAEDYVREVAETLLTTSLGAVARGENPFGVCMRVCVCVNLKGKKGKRSVHTLRVTFTRSDLPSTHILLHPSLRSHKGLSLSLNIPEPVRSL